MNGFYEFFHSILCDKKGGEVFRLFGGWHFFYIALTAAGAAVLVTLLRRRGAEAQRKASRVLIGVAFGMYIADIFLMPLAYGEIDIEKLPFHACTASCVACFLCDRAGLLPKFRTSIVKLGFISNLVYLIYPAGVMWHAVHPLSYRVIQTLLFHCVMSVCGLVTLWFEEPPKKKEWLRDLIVTSALAVWAILGNYIYNGTSDGYAHFFNWFFVVRDPFSALPEGVAPFVMPFLNVAVFFAVETLLTLLLRLLARRRKAAEAA